MTQLRGGGIPLGLNERDRLCHQNIKFEDGDYLIMASDGLSVLGDAINQVLSESKNQDVRIFAQRILHEVAVVTNGTNDDITVMVCKFHKVTE